MATQPKPVLCVGLNPAFQKVCCFHAFSLGRVNRIYRMEADASGKGINVGRVLHSLGKSVLISGFLGGESGKFISETLDKSGLPHKFVWTLSKTRTCTTLIIDGIGEATELVEEGEKVTGEEIRKFLSLYNEILPECGLVVISGTAPPGVPDDIYCHLITTANTLKVPVVLDTHKSFLLKALNAHITVAKPNLHELETAFERKLSEDKDIWEAIEQLQEKGVECIVISNEGMPSYAALNGTRYKIIPPQVTPVNSIGSGDAFAAGIASILLEKRNFLEAIVFGTACGTASTLTPLPGYIDIDQVMHLVNYVQAVKQR